ncbi:MAG: hypothetical protein HUK40_22695 [Desulfobacter sp.]|nr:hypothetical protein [Desulfobacter sp.]
MVLDLVCKKVSEHAQNMAEPEVDPDPVIMCKHCNFSVTKPGFQILVSQKFSHAFANPHGHVFEIGCFSRADGCVGASIPSDEFTWFPGYVWTVGQCQSCSTQLGWIFSSAKALNPERFLGLILDQLIFP